jgi:DNA-binding NtrC family response regulator
MIANNDIKIVAVDDNKVTTSIISKHLQKKHGVRIRTFNSPIKCLYYIRSQVKRGNAPDAVIIDRMMPDIPGDMLSVMIKEVSTKILNILHTGTDPEFIETDKKCYKFDAAYKKNGTMVLDEIVDFVKKSK